MGYGNKDPYMIQINNPNLDTLNNEIAAKANQSDLDTTNQNVSANAVQLAQIVTVNINNYPRIAPESNDNGKLQRAFNDVANGGNLLIPTPNLSLSGSVTMNVAAGASVTVISPVNAEIDSTMAEPGSETALLIFNGTPTSSLFLDNISLVHNAIVTGNLDGFWINNFKHILLNRLSATKFSKWGCLVSGVLGGLITIKEMFDNRYGGMGIEVSSNLVITGGNYSNNGTTAPTDGYGLSLKTSSTQGTYNQNILIQGIYAFNNKRKGIDVHSGHQIKITKNFVIGFGDGGIYAVNEGWDGSTAKEVKDVSIIDNYVDGSPAVSSLYYGIAVGSYGATSSDSGKFIVSENTMANLSYSAIRVLNPQTGGLPAKKVIIAENVIENGSGSIYAIIRGESGGVNTDQIKVRGNILHSVACSIPIDLEQLNMGSVTDNTITVDSGTCSNGIYFPGTAVMICTGNKLQGSATYTTPITIAGSILGQIVKNNIVKGVAYRENVGGGITVEYLSAMPSSGYYYKDSTAWKTNSVIVGTSGSQYVMQGWKRITSGSNHVLNTDWVEMRMPTGT